MSNLKIIFLGTTQFSKEILCYLLDNEFSVSAIFSMNEKFKISYSKEKVKNYNYSDLQQIAKQYNIPYYIVDSDKEKKLSEYENVVSKLQPDIILVMGWYYMIPANIRNIAKYGAWGIHASLLPKYAGGAPLVWAIINGEGKTGVSLFKLDDGIDDGDIIAQKEFDILSTDSIKDVYHKATDTSKELLVSVLKNIPDIKFIKQDKTKIEVYPQRKPDDGEINLSLPANAIYNFIRAQSDPYPGAFIRTSDGKKLIIEKARIE